MQTDTIFTSTPTDELVLRIANAIKVQLEAMLPLLSPPIPEPEVLMTAKQTADFLQVSLPTLHKLTKQKIIPCLRLGCNVRYKKSDVLRSVSSEGLKKSRRQNYHDTG